MGQYPGWLHKWRLCDHLKLAGGDIAPRPILYLAWFAHKIFAGGDPQCGFRTHRLRRRPCHHSAYPHCIYQTPQQTLAPLFLVGESFPARLSCLLVVFFCLPNAPPFFSAPAAGSLPRLAARRRRAARRVCFYSVYNFAGPRFSCGDRAGSTQLGEIYGLV